VASNKKSLKRPSKSAPKRKSKAASKSASELQSIEELLGEEFESLAQARRALKSETVEQVPPPKNSKLPRKKNYTIKELSKSQKQTVNKFLHDKASIKEVDKMVLQPGEFWGAAINYDYYNDNDRKIQSSAKTHDLFETGVQLFDRLNAYISHSHEAGWKSTNAFIDNIKIIKFDAPLKGKSTDKGKLFSSGLMEWYKGKQSEVKSRKERIVKSRKIKRALKKENVTLKEVTKNQDKTIKEMQRKIANLERKNKAAKAKLKPTTKKGTGKKR
jgi:polyhydroxyalkanoate synthesis regulator phasin